MKSDPNAGAQDDAGVSADVPATAPGLVNSEGDALATALRDALERAARRRSIVSRIFGYQQREYRKVIELLARARERDSRVLQNALTSLATQLSAMQQQVEQNQADLRRTVEDCRTVDDDLQTQLARLGEHVRNLQSHADHSTEVFKTLEVMERDLIRLRHQANWIGRMVNNLQLRGTARAASDPSQLPMRAPVQDELGRAGAEDTHLP